jgi:hypothetical protein
MTSGIAQYDFGDVRLSLEVGEDVFKPMPTSRFLIENAAIREGSTVLDLGSRLEEVRQINLIDYVSKSSRNLWHLRIFKATANEIQGAQLSPLAIPS